MVEVKHSYLSHSSINALLTWANRLGADQNARVVLFAPYIARPMAERLISAGVGFADLAGNLHLQLGDSYNWTVLGRPEQRSMPGRKATTPAQIQLLFQFATNPESVNWPVRGLEAAAGISKSMAAQARRHLIEDGLVIRARGGFKLGPPRAISERLLTGYSQILRPKLVLNRFRYPEKSPEHFLERLRKEAGPIPIRYALTGGSAADLLQHYYRGSDISLFVAPWTRSVPQRLRLLPDRDGRVTALRAFGDVVFWRTLERHVIAPPWLIYTELLSGSDPRAHEAAEELRRGFLA